MSGVQVRTQDHLRSKVRKKLEPLIEDQKLMNRQLVMEMAEKGYNRLIEKIGAKKIIQDLKEAEDLHENAIRKARAFFKKTARTTRAYNNSLKYEFSSTEKNEKSPKKGACDPSGQGVRRSRRARRGGKEGKPLRDQWETELDLTRQHPGGVRRIQLLRAFRLAHLRF